MEKFDLHKVYVRGKEGFIEYLGGLNFPGGKRVCPNCKSNMDREPVGATYLKVPGGKIIVDVSMVNGRMILAHGDVPYIWGCESCCCAITPYRKGA